MTRPRREWLLPYALAMALVWSAACTERAPKVPPELIGSWRAPSGTVTFDFLQNQTVGVRVETPEVVRTTWYSWRLVDAEHLQLKPVTRSIRPSTELPSGGPVYTFGISGDALTLTGEDGTRTTYKKSP